MNRIMYINERLIRWTINKREVTNIPNRNFQVFMKTLHPHGDILPHPTPHSGEMNKDFLLK